MQYCNYNGEFKMKKVEVINSYDNIKLKKRKIKIKELHYKSQSKISL